LQNSPIKLDSTNLQKGGFAVKELIIIIVICLAFCGKCSCSHKAETHEKTVPAKWVFECHSTDGSNPRTFNAKVLKDSEKIKIIVFSNIEPGTVITEATLTKKNFDGYEWSGDWFNRPNNKFGCIKLRIINDNEFEFCQTHNQFSDVWDTEGKLTFK